MCKISSFFRNLLRIFNYKMVKTAKLPKLSHIKMIPKTVRGMKHLDREMFSCSSKVSALLVSKDILQPVMNICKSFRLKLEDFKPVQSLSDKNKPFDKCIFLNPNKVLCWTDILEIHRQALNKLGVTENNLMVKEIQVGYKNFRYDDIFKSVLPEGEEIVSGFSQIGHIIHLNLRDHLLEYKSFIGAVLIDKIKSCHTVVNKRSVIDNTYRNFNMEVIAGEENFYVTVKENGCNFEFDFSKVYWNPRLSTEHIRITSSFKPNDILFDVFCGVGPFAIPAAKKKCKVFANDLNPEAYKWLNHNAKHNKIKPHLFNSYNLDGKEFICEVFKNYITDCCNGTIKIPSDVTIHVTMNLPALAVKFVKCFSGLIDDEKLLENFNLNIMIYVYCFATIDDPIETARQMVIDSIGRDLTLEIQDISVVRNVSPRKEMLKVMIKLSKEILLGNSDSESSEPPTKKKCVDSS